ncbi:S-adenosylmethionine mitochondrial carrier protein homolog [Epargyreus clarus]|uniref:S-adenosylmethionine mitochondrial carrier protein homolog n=1 Tax=Epargyreus clarus TaxID=520877 RepID=UPI003C2D0C99
MEEPEKPNSAKIYGAPLLGGAVAGVTVVTALYPLDTLKTRLQSQHGFYKSGGFNGVYRGVLTVATGAIPVTALFFVSYETIKNFAKPVVAPQYTPFVHMFAASFSEVLCCVIKVPVEIAKQRKQTYMGLEKRSSIRILLEAYKTEGFRKGVYRGFLSTVARDMPFSFIELPIWEALKGLVRERNGGEINGLQSAACGALAGCVAGAVTTPLDVVKTRVMLAGSAPRLRPLLADLYLQAGLRGLFTGLLPRIAGIMLGGFIFFGVYDDSKMFFEKYFDR